MPDVIRYVCVARLDGTERVFLWEDEDPGPAHVVVDQEGFVISFPSENAARERTSAEQWNVSAEEASAYDLDAIDRWCRSSQGIHDCFALLNAWNLVVDLAQGDSLFSAADSRSLALYDKLFAGCNLPSITAPGDHYEPVWTPSEVAALKRLLLLGLAELRARFR